MVFLRTFAFTVLFLLLGSAVGFGFFYLHTYQSPTSSTSTASVSPTPTPSASASTYTDSATELSFSIPANQFVEEGTASDIAATPTIKTITFLSKQSSSVVSATSVEAFIAPLSDLSTSQATLLESKVKRAAIAGMSIDKGTPTTTLSNGVIHTHYFSTTTGSDVYEYTSDSSYLLLIASDGNADAQAIAVSIHATTDSSTATPSASPTSTTGASSSSSSLLTPAVYNSIK